MSGRGKLNLKANCGKPRKTTMSTTPTPEPLPQQLLEQLINLRNASETVLRTHPRSPNYATGRRELALQIRSTNGLIMDLIKDELNP